MFFTCKKCHAKTMLAKYYPNLPSDKVIAGWYIKSEYNISRLNAFFEEHEHGCDESNFGGFQYGLEYEVPET